MGSLATYPEKEILSVNFVNSSMTAYVYTDNFTDCNQKLSLPLYIVSLDNVISYDKTTKLNIYMIELYIFISLQKYEGCFDLFWVISVPKSV